MSFGKKVKKVEGSWNGEGKDEEDVFDFWGSCYKLSLNVCLKSIISCPPVFLIPQPLITRFK